MVWWFFCPNITFGEDALSELETIKGKKAFIVTDKIINGLGLAEKVCRILTQKQWEAAIWDGVEPDPKVSTVKSAAEAIKRFGADWIIAVGGGSVMDTAKAAEGALRETRCRATCSDAFRRVGSPNQGEADMYPNDHWNGI